MTVGNVYIGSWGVSLLIISGAALMYVYENELDVFKIFGKNALLTYILCFG